MNSLWTLEPQWHYSQHCLTITDETSCNLDSSAKIYGVVHLKFSDFFNSLEPTYCSPDSSKIHPPQNYQHDILIKDIFFEEIYIALEINTGLIIRPMVEILIT